MSDAHSSVRSSARSNTHSNAWAPFDRRAVRIHRDRAAGLPDEHGFLAEEIAGRLADRLDDVTRRFPRVLVLGGGTALLPRLAGREGIETIVAADLSPAMAAMAAMAAARHGGLAVAADEEALPFAAGAFDLVIALLSLHWVNDLPGALIQINRCLRPDGLFLAAMLGGETLKELRHVLLAAEAEMEGGASPRVSPFAGVRDAGALLQRAGFALPVVDIDTITVTYGDALALMRDLRGMGEANALHERRKAMTRRDTVARAAALYRDLHGDDEGRMPATFQVLTLTGWAPHESQPKPARPGSATARLADALGNVERPAGDRARPKRQS